MVVGACALSGCSNVEQSSRTTTKEMDHRQPDQITEAMVVGEWTISVEPTTDVLARAQFGTQQTITVKAGATQPETNIITTPFNQKQYEGYKAFWTEALNKPEMQWRLILKPDHTGQHIAYDEESNKPKSAPVKWELLGAELRLVYPEEKRFNTFTCRMVSSDELHYLMQPLGGWMVMRRQ
jgi:hypothetical protein